MNDRLSSTLSSVNIAFTAVVMKVDMDVALKVGAFLFVTFPLGLIQWWNLHEKWKARRAKRNASK